MQNTEFPLLFSPIQVGGMTVKNRIFMSAMTTGLCAEDNTVTEEALAYYEARFKGGAGLVTTECVMMDEHCHYSTPLNMGIYADEQVPGLKRLADLAHRYDVRLVAQLLHGGPAAVAALNKGRQPWAASAIPLRSIDEMPLEMPVEEIRALTLRYGDAALRLQAAGLDGVEIHACHRHGILGTFLSPLSNKRTDEYGGDIHGRMRFLLEVISEIRTRLGRDFPIIVRLSMTEFEPGGQSMLDTIYIARTLQKAGVDLLNLSNGTLETYWKTVTPAGTPKGVNTALAGELRAAIDIPVGVIGRNNEPWAAELALSLGRTDVIYMGRALLCDPEFPNKARQGRPNEIRPCIGCTDCITHANGPVIRCTMNPLAGRESVIPPVPEHLKRILVVGGGAAGLHAAAVLAKRGHQVELAEASARLGGQMYLAGIPISKQDITEGLQYLIRNAQDAGVQVHMQTAVDLAYVQRRMPDVVLLATGGSPVIPGFLKGAAQLVSAWDVLDGKVATGRHIVVIGGGAVGCETAEFLAHPQDDLSPNGKRVSVIEMADNLMPNDVAYARSLLVRRMKEKGVAILLNAKVESVSAHEVCYWQDGQLRRIENVDTVVAAIGVRPENGLLSELAPLGIPVLAIGDAEKTGRIYHAIMGAQFAAEQI